MKAAVVHDFARALEIEDVPTPEPGREQVLDGRAPSPRLVFAPTPPAGAGVVDAATAATV